jgi:hypothetical protein
MELDILNSPTLYMYLGFFLICLNVIYPYADILHKEMFIYVCLALLAGSPVIWETQKGFCWLIALLFLQTATHNLTQTNLWERSIARP